MQTEELDDLLLLLDEDCEEPLLEWAAVFGNAQPVEIEIGVGKGRFLIDAAQKNDQINYLGIEWAAKYLRIAQARSQKRQLQNVRFARVDAREFVEFFVPSASVQAYHIYFPDPWPKGRHHKRRLINSSFIAAVYPLLKDRGRVFIATDYQKYAEEIERLFRDYGRFCYLDQYFPDCDQEVH